MQRSFSIVHEDDDINIEEILKENSNQEFLNKSFDSHSDNEENSNSPKKSPRLNEVNRNENIHPSTSLDTSTISRVRSPQIEKLSQLSIDSDGDETENDEYKGIVGEYDPKEYENLDVDDEGKELFQYIVKYIPQQLNLDNKFKPFIPEFLPAVGDIDAFLKVIPPEYNINGQQFNRTQLRLGLEILDEPAANQSDPALLHLQLRASSVKANDKNLNVVVKKVENLEKSGKTIDKWIKDISDLHKSKSSPIVRYSESMPDLDDLMQEWPEKMENYFKENQFPVSDLKDDLSDYINIVCNLFYIPVNKSKIQSLHLLFSLYAAIKTSQLYQAAKTEVKHEVVKEEADKLILD